MTGPLTARGRFWSTGRACLQSW